MRFTKMHGLGNDYLYVYGEVPENVSEVCRDLSDRHFGAGSDGMIFILPSKIADFRMRMFNSDGTEGAMCGNGIRCLGKYVYDKRYTDKTRLKIETLAGVRELELHVQNGKVHDVTVDLGWPSVGEGIDLTADGKRYRCIPVDVGSQHAVIFTECVDCIALTKAGPEVERNNVFPDGVNVEFVQIHSKNSLRMKVWERGSGITLACGTGATACAVAAVRNGICACGETVYVEADGGTLEIVVEADGRARMTGPAVMVYDGETID